MAVFVDTSALYALLNGADRAHGAVASAFDGLLAEDIPLITHNYVLLETVALAQRRLGVAAVAALRDDLAPVLRVHWVDASLHAEALAAAITAREREVSLVDRVSFEIMRRHGLGRALAVDRHFTEQGFELLP